MNSAKINFLHRETFNTHKEFNEFTNKRLSFSIQKSSLVNCSICKSKTHKMRYKLARCNDKTCNNVDACPREVKILYCQKRETVAYYTKGKHNAPYNERRPTHYGITPIVKEKLEDLIFNYDSRPHRLHLKLNKLKEKKKIDIDHMPTLKQVQDFISNRKKRIGDSNNMEDLKAFISDLRYEDGFTQDNELFVFGDKFGDGSENNHFQLGKNYNKDSIF
jgi:hypothetical protein